MLISPGFVTGFKLTFVWKMYSSRIQFQKIRLDANLIVAVIQLKISWSSDHVKVFRISNVYNFLMHWLTHSITVKELVQKEILLFINTVPQTKELVRQEIWGEMRVHYLITYVIQRHSAANTDVNIADVGDI